MAKLISLEMLVMLVIIGISWGTMAAGQSNQAETIAENKEEIKEIKDSIGTIETDIAIIKNERKHTNKAIAEQNIKIEKILELLQN